MISESRSLPTLFDRIRALVDAGRYVVSTHASERLEERGIIEWQVVVGLDDGELLAVRPDSLPNPSVEVVELLPDGTEFKAVWSLIVGEDLAKLVTVHYFDE